MLAKATDYFKTRSQKQLLGLVILALPFVGLFFFSLYAIGFNATMAGFAFIAGIAVIVGVGVHMAFTDDEDE